jgi:hypothetical protein
LAGAGVEVVELTALAEEARAVNAHLALRGLRPPVHSFHGAVGPEPGKWLTEAGVAP